MPQMRDCAAIRCDRRVPSNMLCCRVHWRRLPRQLQARVWEFYQEGQEEETGPTPSLAYLRAAEDAIAYLAQEEGYPLSENPFIAWREMAELEVAQGGGAG